MKQTAPHYKAIMFLWLMLTLQPANSQQNNCILKPPLLHMHFGRGNVRDVNSSPLPNYERVSGSCPMDGHYSFSSSSPGCNEGAWFVLAEDHTPGDQNGNMMVVNAYPGGGPFLKYPVKSLKANTTYEFAVWLMNICRLDACCSSLSPNIYILLTTNAGKKIAGFLIGELSQSDVPVWRKYSGFFIMPAGETELVFTMQDNAIGGCGNDFALDDITISECVKPASVIAIKPKAVPTTITKRPPPEEKKVAKKEPAKKLPIKNMEKQVATTKTYAAPLPVQKPAVGVPLPLVLRTRENTLARQIETVAGEIQIALYDNGEIDGDTVTIYHNNELLISGARLSQKPVSLRITVDVSHPHHELVMVADNLGSIPPNTSLMIITTKDKRYQVFISSSEQKNAKVVIDLKE